MVRGVDSKYVYTIEGNSSNAVRLKQYLLTDSSIAGYGRPNYALVADRFEDDVAAPALDNIPADWSEKAVRWATSHGLMVGDNKGNLMLRDPVTREQLMVFLYRFAEMLEA